MQQKEFNILHSKLNSIICHHTVFISNRATNENGTGILISINDYRFIITARHVIQGTEQEQLDLWLGVRDQTHNFTIRNMWSDKYLDIAFIELDTFEADILRVNIEPFKVNFKQNGYTLKQFNAIAICGYPKTFWKIVDSKIFPESFTISVQYFLEHNDWPPRAKEEFNKDKFLMVPLLEKDGASKLVDRNGKPATPINIAGLSGSPLWVFNLDKINDKEPQYALLGIYTGYLVENPSILKCTQLNAILENIEAKYAIKILL